MSPETAAGPDPPPLKHVAVIMAGNGRWAAARGLERWDGHRAGMTAVRETIEAAVEAGVRHLTMFAFSDANWSRPRSEIAALMDLLVEYVQRERHEMSRRGVRVTVFGDRTKLPARARSAIKIIERDTQGGDTLEAHFAISYGSRNEIVHATRRLARQVRAGDLKPEEISREVLSREMWTGQWPDPDLLIRTSGERRLSDFLLWQLAYAELYTVDTLWPDFRREHFHEAVRDFRMRERRFGGVATRAPVGTAGADSDPHQDTLPG